MTQMLAQREHDYFAETVICANCYIVAKNSRTPHRSTAYGAYENLFQILILPFCKKRKALFSIPNR